jgi:hypothetical protein
VGLQECTREGGRTPQEGANWVKDRPHFIIRLDLVGAALEDAAHGPIAPVAGIQRSLAGALESFNSEAIDQTQHALRLTEMVEGVIEQQLTNQLVGGWPDRLGLAQAGLRRGAQECLVWFRIMLHPRRTALVATQIGGNQVGASVVLNGGPAEANVEPMTDG